MSEELLQTIPQQLGKYTYYRLGSTTLEQLKNHGVIPAKDYGDLKAKKPDGLLLCQGSVRAVVEYKPPGHLRSESNLNNAIQQEIEVAEILCKLLIVTDGVHTFWVNAKRGDFVTDRLGNQLRTIFHPTQGEMSGEVESLLDEIEGSLSVTNSSLHDPQLIDPSPIASRLWQTIWVATGKSPVKCLYNVVELFIFKFLSDLEVLREDYAFNHVHRKSEESPEEALEYYARNSRRHIYQLFPAGNDGTTVINGTIFVTETGEPNLSQSILFKRCLNHLYTYGEEVGSLTKIDKQFKTKLYESFLNQEVEALGQYFTPRKIVQSIIRMAGINDPGYQYEGMRICDPFCGVGGFLLEMLNMNEGMRRRYTPDSEGNITVPFEMHGFDKGFERDDERTIILAKANMLIYLAELLFTYPSCAKEFADVFNRTFKLFQDNLGTFGYIIENEEDRYDLILSNPPYVTSGSSIIKEEIRQTARTMNEYPISGLGLESLSIEWIIKSLRGGGKAFLVIPDGILARVNGKSLRDYILQECFLNAVISLPQRTFFANFKQTYILAITKKNNRQDIQTAPVFSYIVSNIGEKLTSVKREEIDENDLPEMENLYRMFQGNQSIAHMVESQSPRCKAFPFEKFRDSSHWVTNRWWPQDEIALWEGPADVVSAQDVESLLSELRVATADYEDALVSTDIEALPTQEVALGDEFLFRSFLGKRVLKKDANPPLGSMPLYSSNVYEPFGMLESSNVDSFDYPALLWGIDGNFEWNYIAADQPFATTDHCGTLQILDSNVVPEYLLYAISLKQKEESFSRTFRASLANISEFKVKIPIRADGTFDVELQKEIAEAYMNVLEKGKILKEIKQKLDDTFSHFVG